uniref:Uncharacterized protein n=1 Tax=Arundo donax TaxID=35708 RepID=A0A0A9C0A1_ARUDO
MYCEWAWDQLVTRASVAPTSSGGPGFDLQRRRIP